MGIDCCLYYRKSDGTDEIVEALPEVEGKVGLWTAEYYRNPGRFDCHLNELGLEFDSYEVFNYAGLYARPDWNALLSTLEKLKADLGARLRQGEGYEPERAKELQEVMTYNVNCMLATARFVLAQPDPENYFMSWS